MCGLRYLLTISPPSPGGGSCVVPGPSIHLSPLPPGGGSCDVRGPSEYSEDQVPGGGIDISASESQATTPVVVDGLLCSIIKSLPLSDNGSELTATIDCGVPEVEVKNSWWKLLNYFENAVDEARKVKIKDIRSPSVS